MSNLRDYLFHEEPGITLYCGDCRDVLPLLESRPDFVLTDPPYAVAGLGRYDGDAMVTGSDDAFWVLPALREITRVMKPDAFMVSFYGWRHVDDFLVAWRACGLNPVGHLVWVKRQWGLGKYVRAKHESAYLLTKGAPEMRSVIADVLDWQREPDRYHPAGKPVNALSPIIAAIDPVLVLDPFVGAGASILAAKGLGIPVIGIEIEPKYCEIAVKRLRQEVLL